MRRKIVCLANSYKHGGRCVAGLCLETGEWIRLRGAAGDGALSPREYCLGGHHGDVRLLDVFEAELHYALPTDAHPEDWVIAGVEWKLVERPCSAARWAKVLRAEETAGGVLGGYKDRVAADDVSRKPRKTSLALISPDDLWWWVKEENGKRKNRALFQRNHVMFNLAVTDPKFLDQLNLMPAGIYPNQMLVPTARHTWLTVSLSEGFAVRAGADAWHYRLVAGVVSM